MTETDIVCIGCGMSFGHVNHVFTTVFKRINGVNHRVGVCANCSQRPYRNEPEKTLSTPDTHQRV